MRKLLFFIIMLLFATTTYCQEVLAKFRAHGAIVNSGKLYDVETDIIVYKKQTQLFVKEQMVLTGEVLALYAVLWEDYHKGIYELEVIADEGYKATFLLSKLKAILIYEKGDKIEFDGILSIEPKHF